MNDSNPTSTDGHSQPHGHTHSSDANSDASPGLLPIRSGGCGKCANCTCESDAATDAAVDTIGTRPSPNDVTPVATGDQ